jgi:hypothetical protein
VISSENHQPTHVFILGTGRNGSQAIAQWLSDISGCRVIHEARPLLLQESADFISGRGISIDTREILRQTRNIEALGGRRLSGESNQRLSLLVSVLQETFPKARYVWLVRDGRSVVASLYQRHWYHPREASIRPARLVKWANTRIRGDEVGDMTSPKWDRLDAFGRCCWYWSFTNRHIKNEIQRLGLNAFLCRLERLNDEGATLLRFLELPSLEMPPVPRVNTSQGWGPISWQYWSTYQLETFHELAGSLMDELYPGWEDQMTRTKAMKFLGHLHRGVRVIREVTRPARQRLGLTTARAIR